jgi:putative toxin-antitoxin system antitoxin component (TIGR02293 family)
MRKAMADPALIEQDIARTYALLGGRATMTRPVRNSLEAHDLLLNGLPSPALLHLTKEVGMLSRGSLLDKAIGISLRTLQRRKKDAEPALLSVDQSNRAWKFAEILGRASDIFGSRAEAEAWLERPAIGLDQRRPVDLLATSVGVEAVEQYLTRIEYGVHT